jgi:diguanylate cyclase (GGDEF)-like protein
MQFLRMPLLLALQLFIAVVTPSAQAEADPFPMNLHFERFSAEQGFAVGSVEVIFQDSRGYMWFGGPDGLTQYDGYNFITYRNKPNDQLSLSSNSVWDVFEDHQGVLWITTDGGLNRFDRNKGNFTHFKYDKNNPQGICADVTRNMIEDPQGNLWIATYSGLARFDAQRQSFSCYSRNSNDKNALQTNEISRLFMDRSGKLWLGTEAGKLYWMDLNTQEIQLFSSYPTNPAIVSIFQDRDGLLWVGTEGNGLTRINTTSREMKHFAYTLNNPNGISHPTIKDIAEDERGNLWLATESGLDLLNRQTFEFAHYVHNPAQKGSLASSTVRSLFVDANHDLWVGNFPTGLNYLDTSNLAFKTYHHDVNDPNSLPRDSVLAIKEDSKRNLWLGTDGGGLTYFNRQTQQFTNYLPNPTNPESISAPAVLSIEEDMDGTLWLGTWEGGLNHFDPNTGKVFKIYRTNLKDPGSIGGDSVWSIFRDSKNNLWMSTIGGGLNRFDRTTDKFIHYREQQDGSTATVFWSVYEDHLGQIWAASDGLAKYNPEKDNFFFFKSDSKNVDTISSNSVLGMAEDAQKHLWIATRGGGLNMLDRTSGKFTHITEKDGLHSDIVMSIKPDSDGNLWLGSTAGLVRFNPADSQFIYYNEKNGLQGDNFNIGTSIKTKAGEMVVGGTNGFTIFDPATLKTNTYLPRVAIVDFQIFNKSVIVGEPDSPLTKHISQTDSITLNYDQSVFSFSFTAMSYRNSGENKFAYILEGFEEKWNYVNSKRRNATYTNLNPGTYTFRVKAANNQGLWNDAGQSITLHILPPPWKTWWAYACYILLAIGLLKWFIYVQRKQVIFLGEKVRERTAELEQKNQQLEDAYAQLEAISLSDPLTGLSNRRYLQKLIPMDIVKVQRAYIAINNGKPERKHSLDLTFVLLDIDFFKPVNDIYGHSAGDQLLIQISQLLTKICRESDCVVRWGGEEFLIVSRYTCRDEAPLMAERIRKSIEQHPFVLGDGTVLHKTCSIGFACFPFLRDHTDALSWEQVIDIADHALYAAKKSGRNRCVGLATTAATPSEHLYEKLSQNLKGMLEEGELLVISKSDDELVWD